MGDQARELSWVFRPGQDRSAEIQDLAGVAVHATGLMGADGSMNVVLRDGSRVRASRGELSVE